MENQKGDSKRNAGNGKCNTEEKKEYYLIPSCYGPEIINH
jgi:hypothetical protein